MKLLNTIFALCLVFVSCPNEPEIKLPETVTMPTANIPSGTYDTVQNVTLSTTTIGASIYYTLNGTTPTTNSTLYENPIAITETATLKAIAVKSGMNDSGIYTAYYTVLNTGTNPTLVDYLNNITNQGNHSISLNSDEIDFEPYEIEYTNITPLTIIVV
jgi:hypothetical protein